MIDLFKKKQEKKEYINTIGGQDKEKKELDKKVVVHTMPDRFFAHQPQAAKSKRTGVIILVGGAVLLTIIFAVAYILFIKSRARGTNDPKQIEVSDVVDIKETSEIKIEQEIKNDKSASMAAENNNIIPKKEDARIITPDIKTEETETTTTKNMVAVNMENSTTTPENNQTATTTAPANNENNPAPAEPDIKIKAAIDTDGDGLSDAEEMLLGSDKNMPDSDQDGYKDGAEVLNLYNPAGTGKIIVNTGIERYISEKYGYILYYPKAGTLSQIGGEDSIMIRLENNQFFQILIQPDVISSTLEEWYKEQFEVNLIKSSQNIFKPGWAGIRSDDGLIVYLTPANSQSIYTLSYNLGIDYTLYYMNIFEIMIRSLELEK